MNESTPIHLVFLLEEESAKNLLKVLLPKILPPPSCVTFQCIAHQGKSHLQKSIPNRIRIMGNRPNTFFVILHDQDSHKCKVLKSHLQTLCKKSGYDHNSLIRIVCQELESWYFGDLDAVQKVFPKFPADKYKNRKKFRTPDAIVNPGEELKKIIQNFDKGYASREVPKYMDIDNKKSVSFHQTIKGIKRLVNAKLIAQKN